MLLLRNLKRNSWGVGLVLTLLIWLFASGDIGPGPAKVNSAESEWDHLTILYHSDCKGKIEPCG